MYNRILLFFLLCACGSCRPEGRFAGEAVLPGTVADIPLPEHCTQDTATPGSFAGYLSGLRLRNDPNVYLYNGEKKRNQQAQHAVIDLDIGTRDLQQCADAVIRLRAEYLYARKRYDDIRFRFTNGQECAYSRYAEGYRSQFRGNTFSWVKTAPKDYSYPVFRNYLELVFSYAGTTSLHGELLPVAAFSDIRPGDVLIQKGQPYGHAVIVLRVAQHTVTRKKLFLLAQSYMPAQDIHILRNPHHAEWSPWYSEADIRTEIVTPEWTFAPADLRRFAGK